MEEIRPFTKKDLEEILTDLAVENPQKDVLKWNSLRSWQQEGLLNIVNKHSMFLQLDRNIDDNEINKYRTFIVTAFPGSGKTIFSLLWFLIARKKGWIDSFIVISPTSIIADNWINTACSMGIELKGKKPSEAMSSLNGEYLGRSITYKKLESFATHVQEKETFKQEVENNKVLLFSLILYYSHIYYFFTTSLKSLCR